MQKKITPGGEGKDRAKQQARELIESGDIGAIERLIQYAETAKDDPTSTSCFLRGRLVVKETRRPLPDLLVTAYWVNLEAQGGRPWYSQIADPGVVRAARSTLTDSAGTFAMSIDMQHTIGPQPAIALLVGAPDGEDEEHPPVYRSPAPRAIGTSEEFLIRVPEDRAKAADVIPSNIPAGTEFLDQAKSRSEEIRKWLKKDKQKQIEKENSTKDKAKRAFKKFKPSMLPESARKRGNYLEDRKDLGKVLLQTQDKALKRLVANPVLKKRRVVLPPGLMTALRPDDTTKEIEIDTAQMPELLKTDPRHDLSTMNNTLAAADRRRTLKEEVAEKLLVRLREKAQVRADAAKKTKAAKK